MKIILILIACMQLAGWALGCFRWDAGACIHILLAFAVIACILAFFPKAANILYNSSSP